MRKTTKSPSEKIVQHDPDFLSAGILLARGPFDALDDLLARALSRFGCLYSLLSNDPIWTHKR